jgi:membrane associated rhomboid family serine protease
MIYRNNFFRPTGFQAFPPVVKSIMILNGVMFVLSMIAESSFGIDLQDKLGLHNFASPLFQPFQIVTHFFMHGSFMHIFLNMLSLWMFGSAIENYWGGQRFLVYYLVTGLGAAFIHLLYSNYDYENMLAAANTFAQNPQLEGFMEFSHRYAGSMVKPYFDKIIEDWNYNSPLGIELQAKNLIGELVALKRDVPMVGASGAVFGVLLAFGMMFPDQMVFVLFFPMPARLFVILYGGFELVNGIKDDPTSNVAHFAHLGGMLFGYLLIKYWQKTKGNQH